jgi:hypothetical protein
VKRWSAALSWFNRDLERAVLDGGRSVSAGIVIFSSIALLATWAFLGSVGRALLLVVVVGFWLVFLWRGWLALRRISAREDRVYDRRTRFRLSREYRESESATAAKARRDRDAAG